MQKIEVRQALISERNLIIEFIRDHWKSDHVFVTSPDLFDWQYKQDNKYNLIISILKAGEKITVLGILGYIPTRKYDPTLESNDVFLAVWKTHESLSPPGLGLRLLKYIQSELKPNIIGAIGISDYVKPIYKLLGYDLAQLDHYALFNPEYTGPRLALNVPDESFQVCSGSSEVNLFEIKLENIGEHVDQINELSCTHRPHKSSDYIIARYLDHPWYQYNVQAVVVDGVMKTILIWRKLVKNGGQVLRIVDVIGYLELMAKIEFPLQQILRAENVEYIDIMSSGLDPCILKSASFISKNDHNELILPNYFSPFVQENITIELAVKSFDKNTDSGDIVLFRADSDQDRPNNISELKNE